MHVYKIRFITAVFGLLCATSLLAGERIGIDEAVQSFPSNWNNAQFSIDVSGPSSGNVTVGQQIQVSFEAVEQGYLTYFHVTSHGDIKLFRDGATAAKSGKAVSYAAKAPLGREQMFVLFSNKPLDDFFTANNKARELGNRRSDAAAFIEQLSRLEAAGTLIASRKIQYTVLADAAGTQYTTRGIIREVQAGARQGGSSRVSLPSRVEYEFGSDHLTERGKLDLDTFGEALVSDLRGKRVVLEGHTDSVGTDDYNLTLSERRAAVAKRYLIESFGLPESQLTSNGKGKSDPLAPNDTDANRSRNRRVDFIFSAQ